METQGTRGTFDFDPYENIKIVKNLDDEILIITRHRIRSILQEFEDSLGKKDLWITPFTLLVALIALFPTSDFKDFIVSSDTWRAFFMMLSLSSIVWLFITLRIALKCKRVDDILSEFMQENIPYSLALRSAPRVIETYPRKSEIIRAPKDGLDIIFSVTYDQEMASGFSWCSTEKAYPEQIPDEDPYWTNDHKTCNLKMRVYPNVKYGIQFNVRGRYENFRSVNGVSAEPYLLEFETLESTGAED
jgi:hypothetical protein